MFRSNILGIHALVHPAPCQVGLQSVIEGWRKNCVGFLANIAARQTTSKFSTKQQGHYIIIPHCKNRHVPVKNV